MKKLLIVLTLLALPFATYSQTAQQPAQEPAQPATPAATPPARNEPSANAAGHEFSPLQEKTVNYKDWTLPNLTSDEPENLRKLMTGKKLVMIVYFAPWCRNWRFEMPVAVSLYEKYKDQGFQVIGVSEYAPRTEVYSHFGAAGAPFPIVAESESREDKSKTLHYTYRQLTGDTRNWGSPWNIFLEPAKLNKKGEVLTEKAWIVNGELIEDEVDKFIASKLLPSTTVKTDPK
ncbi:MAG TPA: TlpA disulfide reductase family protein [Pyrinomonadaceae bacterium]|nr:TlpA disulfide reductase family protein [Pyrinomonadaceae bacterium]